MSNQYPGGLITKTPVVPNSISAPGIWTLTQQAAAQATNTWPFPRDPQFNYVTMLLHGDGSAGVPSTGSGAGASSTVTNFNADASTNNFNVTINGDARSNNFTPYQEGYYSNYFGGSGNSINYPSASQYAIGTGNFTLEFFVNFSALNAGHNRMFAIGASGTDGLEIDLNGTNLEVGIQNGYPIGYTWVPTVNTWYYMAVTRSGSTVTLYINGTSVATGTSSNSISQNSLSIGGITWQSTWSINGFLSNVRLSNTIRTIATPTTPYTSDANTLFLGAQSNRFLDNSSYVATATPSGTPQVFPAIPFTLPSSVATYGSGYFDGSSDFLSVTSATPFDFGSGNFTLECWAFTNNFTSDYRLIAKIANIGSFGSWQILIDTSGYPRFYASSAASSWDVASNVGGGVAIAANTWNHIAVTRSGTTFTIWVNGVSSGTTTNSSSIYYSAAVPVTVGGMPDGTRSLPGYITDARILKGTALYTTTFTPPTAPLTAITNTSLLTTQYNGGGNNSGFKDSSQFNFPITRNGNTTQGTFTPYGADWSNYFDGTGDRLTVPANAAFNFSTGDFTVECWFYTNSVSANQWIVGPDNTVTYPWVLQTSGSAIRFLSNNAANIFSPTSFTLTVGTWNHFAVTRSGSTMYWFTNGTLNGTQTYSTAIGSNTIDVQIGTTGSGSGDPVNGYISNLRVVKGTAVYTSSFTPSTTPLTAITNTSLLTCQSNRFIDNSSNAFTITKYNDVSVQGFSPFAPLTVYNPATNGGSAYFDGTGDYLNLPNNSNLQLGSSNFTLEGWVYLPVVSGVYQFFNLNSNSSYSACVLQVNAGQLQIAVSTSGSGWAITPAAGTITANQWNHVAVSRSGTDFYLYINGSRVNTSTTSGALYAGTTNEIGRIGSSYYAGYLTDAKFTIGTALYTASTYTVPTAPLTVGTNTQLLTNFTNAAILDNSMLNNLETVGNAQISTSVVKYGTASMYFDGTGDYLVPNAPSSNVTLGLGSGDFTVEFWVYFISGLGSDILLYDGRPLSTNGVYPTIYVNSSSQLSYVVSSSDRITSASAFSTSTWYHIALARSGTSTKMFVNGTQVGSTYTDSNNYLSAARRPVIAINGFNETAAPLNGYLDDLRVTRGFCRYTTTFTAPTQAFPNG